MRLLELSHFDQVGRESVRRASCGTNRSYGSTASNVAGASTRECVSIQVQANVTRSFLPRNSRGNACNDGETKPATAAFREGAVDVLTTASNMTRQTRFSSVKQQVTHVD